MLYEEFIECIGTSRTSMETSHCLHTVEELLEHLRLHDRSLVVLIYLPSSMSNIIYAVGVPSQFNICHMGAESMDKSTYIVPP